MKIRRILLTAQILSSVFSITYLQDDQSTEVKVAADRVGARGY
ncbi:phosphatase [Bacillus siamensis]|nr:phosphatase [Bacillus siamensis]UZD74618.1 phosphatase [Bacillus siamensis]